MSFLLGIFHAIIPGTGLFIIFNTVLFYGGMALFVKHLPKVSALISILIILVCLNPLVLVYNGIVWKDVLFANLAILGFSAAAFEHGQKQRQWLPLVFNLLSLLAFSAVILVRPQGILVAFIGACVLGIKSRHQKFSIHLAQSRWRQFFRKFSGPIIVQILLCLTFSKIISIIVEVTAVTYLPNTAEAGIKAVMIYDIAGIVYRNPDFALLVFQNLGVDLSLFKSEVMEHYTSARFDFLLSPGQAFHLLKGISSSDVRNQWIDAILSNPTAYLSHRFSLFTWQMGLRDQVQCLPTQLGMNAEPATLIENLQLSRAESQFIPQLSLYSRLFFNTPVYAAISYITISVISLGVLIRHLNRATLAIVGLAIAGLVFALTYLLIGFACDLRYVYFSIVAGMISGVYAVSIIQAQSQTHQS